MPRIALKPARSDLRPPTTAPAATFVVAAVTPLATPLTGTCAARPPSDGGLPWSPLAPMRPGSPPPPAINPSDRKPTVANEIVLTKLSCRLPYPRMLGTLNVTIIPMIPISSAQNICVGSTACSAELTDPVSATMPTGVASRTNQIATAKAIIWTPC